MKKIFFILCLFLLNSASCIAIVETSKLSIQEAVEIAKKNNLDIQLARLNISIEKNNIKSSKKFQNPEIGLFYNLGKAGKGNPQQIGLSQLVEIGKRSDRKKLAQTNFQLAKNNVEYLEFDLRMDVREAYTNLLAKKTIYASLKKQEHQLNELLNETKIRHKKGIVEQIDVLQAQLLLNQILTEVNSADYNVKTALFEFNKVINSPEGFYDTKEEKFSSEYKPLLIPKPDSKMPDFDLIDDKAVENRYDIKIAKQELEAAEKELKIVLKKRIPDVEITGGYSYQNPGQSGEGTFKHGAFVGANIVNIPIFNNYSSEIKNAELKVEQNRLNYQSVLNKALNELKKTYEKFLMAQVALKNYNEQLLLNSEELIKTSRAAYKKGEIDLTTLVTMEESYRMILVAYTYALADYYNSWNAFIREVNDEKFTINSVENL